MMVISLFIWIVLIAIGVSDAKTHRIPNQLLILLLVSLCLSTFMQTQQALWSVFLDNSAAFAMAFIFALALYLLRVMAPGDVKLIAVIGFYLGTSELVNYFYSVCLMSAFVGSMYWSLNRLHVASKASETQMNLASIAVNMQLGQQELKRKIVTGNDLTYMPFAPILVIALALHQYYI